MRLASLAGIEIPLHGLLYGRDNELTYFIRRFDRTGKYHKLHVEDFAQLSGKSRDTKYNSSMEQVVKIIEKFCTFPALEKVKLFRIVLFCFLTGNEDMHLKNLSLIQKEDITTLAPSYDLLNTSVILSLPEEELALPMNGKKNKLQSRDFILYFAKDRLLLTDKLIHTILSRFKTVKARPSGAFSALFMQKKDHSWELVSADQSVLRQGCSWHAKDPNPVATPARNRQACPEHETTAMQYPELLNVCI